MGWSRSGLCRTSSTLGGLTVAQSGEDRTRPRTPASRDAKAHRSSPLSDFSSFYEEHVFAVYGFFGYRLSSRDDAEDLTQQTFERALRARARYNEDLALPRTWLMTIAHNLLVDHLRRHRSGRMVPLSESQEGSGVAEGLVASTSAANIGLDPELEGALSRLSDRDRELVALRFGGDLTGPEIAEMTGLQLPAVQQALSRALRRIRAELGQPVEAPEGAGIAGSPPPSAKNLPAE